MCKSKLVFELKYSLIPGVFYMPPTNYGRFSKFLRLFMPNRDLL